MTSTTTDPTPTAAIDPERVQAFLERAIGDCGGALGVALAALGDRLGLFAAMADGRPVQAGELAARTATHERYVREWLNAQAAGGYVVYTARDDAYTLPAEHALVLLGDGPADLGGQFRAVAAALAAGERLETRFRSGEGLGWHEQDHDLFCGVERGFAASYRTSLVSEWLPALDGVVERLRAGARVADIGCGHGSSTIIMAQAFPQSRFIGFDYHAASIDTARRRAQEAGVADRVRFEVATAAAYPGTDYDLVCCFDALHDMGDPVGAARHVRATLTPAGTWLVVEPFAGDRIEDNLNPIGRLYYGMSTLLCTPGSLSQPGRAGLGAQAGEARLREVLGDAGFTHVRRAAETPLNLVLEVRV
jgi:2-polyprenyl-3-methyl-5-hydroxy-6-metoxy-1,4-benzoquinol methylase